MSKTAESGSPASPWILNAWKDLALFVATPLLIIPLVVLLRGVLTVEDLSLYVLSFGAMGHHLPGMLRAYGDRELFARYRTRFIVAPLFLVAVCTFFAHRDLNGLFLMSLMWGTWHGMAQIYGFLRIYDAKAKSFAPLTARLDMAMCVAWFGLGIVQSPHRMGTMLNAYYKSGGPFIPASAIELLQSAAIVVTACVTAAFLANWIWQTWQGRQPSLAKLLLMTITFAFWWYAMIGIKNVIVGVAMFEIFHDVQYLAIVWVYNVKRVENASQVGAVTSFMFRRSWLLAGLYVGLVFAYGSINLFSETFDTENVKLTLFGMVTASGFLHFYYDGFIWKVREKSTREGLGLSGGQSQPSNQPLVPGWLAHGLKWSLFVVPAALLGSAQMRGVRPDLERQLAIVDALPNSSEAHNELGVALGRNGQHEDAIKHFQRALDLDPSHGRARCNLGNTMQDLGRFDEAVAHWQEALRIQPDLAEAHNNWGNALQALGRFDEAVAHWDLALQANPDYAAAHYNLGKALQDMGRFEEAIGHYEQAVRIEPQAAEAHNSWGNALQAIGRFDEAVEHYRQALQIRPEYAEAHYNYGNALQGIGSPGDAATQYREALRIEPDYAMAHNNLGLALAVQGRLQEAVEHFQHCLRLDPRNETARQNLNKAQQLLQQNNPTPP
jgi:tetratricopeptide (TPR) repeat protein